MNVNTITMTVRCLFCRTHAVIVCKTLSDSLLYLPSHQQGEVLLPPKKIILFSIFFVLYELTIYLSNDMIMPAMLQVVDSFHAPTSDISLSLSLYILGGSSLQIFLGPIADRISKRKVMLFGNLLFLFATALIPFVGSMDQFLAARFFQGMGSCFIFIGYAMIHEWLDDSAAVKLTTLLANVAIFAPLAGPVVGSGIISSLPWPWIFAVSGVLGIISLLGLYKYMPDGSATENQTGDAAEISEFSARAVWNSYLNILRNRQFMFGIAIAGFALVPLTAWIGLSPAIIIENMHASYATYIIDQCVIFSGFILSSFLIQRIGDDFSLSRLIRQGSVVALLGLVGAGVTCENPHIFIVCMFIFAFGFGLFNGALIRISLVSTGESMSLSSSAMSLLYCLYIALGLQIYNLICEQYSYSLASYALLNVPVGVIIFLCLRAFLKMEKNQKSAEVAVA